MENGKRDLKSHERTSCASVAPYSPFSILHSQFHHMTTSICYRLLGVTLAIFLLPSQIEAQEKQTARELGVVIGILPPGPLNAITDVAGVRVGHTTVAIGDSINTGVTAVLPHAGSVFRQKVPAAFVVGNGFGKFAGGTQVQELGEIETPILLTCTLCVPRAADALMSYMLSLPGHENVRSVNPVVGETNDGFLNRVRSRAITEQHVFDAINNATDGPVAQGSVGAGRGTIAFGWKGGIGTSSRQLTDDVGGYTVGVLVQSNHGGVLTVAGVPVGPLLENTVVGDTTRYRPPGRGGVRPRRASGGDAAPFDEQWHPGDGSIIMVVATDAPLDSRSLERLAKRALLGLGRGGGIMSNGSGDYVIAFSTTPVNNLSDAGPLSNSQMSPLFLAAIEATEEAILNSLFMATPVDGDRGRVEALPIDRVLEIVNRR